MPTLSLISPFAQDPIDSVLLLFVPVQRNWVYNFHYVSSLNIDWTIDWTTVVPSLFNTGPNPLPSSCTEHKQNWRRTWCCYWLLNRPLSEPLLLHQRILLPLCFSDDKRPRIWEARLSFFLVAIYLSICYFCIYLYIFLGCRGFQTSENNDYFVFLFQQMHTDI